MDLGEGIALNEALRENLFMLLVSATWQQLPWLWCVVQLEVFFQNDVDPFFKGDIIIFKKNGCTLCIHGGCFTDSLIKNPKRPTEVGRPSQHLG